jgi:Zn-dependent protease
MDLSAEHIRLILQTLIILILSVAVHEFGHAFVAHKLGDRLPKSQGRVTLNPAAHADLIGTLLFPVIALIATKGASIGFGWGKPVQVNPVAFSRRYTMRTGHMMVAAAGPAMNILFALFIATVHVTLVATDVVKPYSDMYWAIETAVIVNFVLCFFNLIPAPPLDGGTVIEGLLPARMVPRYQEYSRYGPLVLFAVIFIPELQLLFVKPALWLHAQLYSVLGLPTLMS